VTPGPIHLTKNGPDREGHDHCDQGDEPQQRELTRGHRSAFRECDPVDPVLRPPGDEVVDHRDGDETHGPVSEGRAVVARLPLKRQRVHQARNYRNDEHQQADDRVGQHPYSLTLNPYRGGPPRSSRG
jgi:hypothetical protein